jgi:leader peptidase (prepilin peptidase)/N-methyltransferase
MIAHSQAIYAAIAIATILIPYITCITCQYPKIMLQEYRDDCAEFLEAAPSTEQREQLLGHRQARYPNHNLKPPIFAYLPLVGFFYGIATAVTAADKHNQYYFLALELLLSGITYHALSSNLALGLILPYTVFYIALLIMAAIDYRTRMLPDAIVIPTMWLGLALSSMSINISYPEAVWGAILGYTVPWAIAKASQKITKKNGMGNGDFKMIAMLGAWLGPVELLGCVFMASCFFIVIFAMLAAAKKITRQTPVAFGPFLAIAAVILLNTSLFGLWPLNTLMLI